MLFEVNRDLLDDKHNDISFLQVISIARDIAKGIKHVHSQDIYHRDLSARLVNVITHPMN